MSDAFADLWNATGASKPAEAPRKLGAMAATPPSQAAVTRKPQNDVFSMLAATGSSSSITRSTTPRSLASGPVPLRPIQQTPSGGTRAAAGSRGGDAFSGLLSGTFAAQSSSNANLTMAQRAALAEKEKLERTRKTQPSASASSAWAGLDALGGSSITTSAPTRDPLEDLGFSSFSSSPAPARTPSKSPQPAPPAEDDWGLGDFSSQSAPVLATSSKPTPAYDLFGFDDFIPASTSGNSTAPAPQRSTSPGDFDFGSREDGLLGNQSDEDDILGDLGKPVEQLAAVSPRLHVVVTHVKSFRCDTETFYA